MGGRLCIGVFWDVCLRRWGEGAVASMGQAGGGGRGGVWPPATLVERGLRGCGQWAVGTADGPVLGLSGDPLSRLPSSSAISGPHCPPHPPRWRGFKRRPGRSGENSGQSPALGQWLRVGGRPCLVRKPKLKCLPGTGQRAPRATQARNQPSCNILKIGILGLIRVDVWQKSTQYRIAITLPLKIN